jgi:hypothetical protein
VAAPGAAPSCLFAGHGPALWGFFLAAAVPQALRSPDDGIGVPFGWGGGAGIVVTDEVEEFEEFEEMEDEELAR